MSATPEIKAAFEKEFSPDLVSKFRAFLKKFNLPATAAAPGPAIQAPPAQVLQESKLADGTTIKYDTPSLAQGSVVTVVTPEGELPCPEGEHTLEDGTKITVVSKDGKSVVETVTPAAAPTTPEVQAAAPDYAKQIADIIRNLSGFESQVAELKKENAELKKENSEIRTAFESQKNDIGEFMGLFSQFLSAAPPSAEPVERPKNKTKKGIINTLIS